jgi:antitoxin (DNA-binding transcriptional repressor) of toxin-antitoxin stability system
MTEVTVREFSYNPSAMFARVEKGETIEVTRHGKVIAEVIPPRRPKSRLEELIADGTINPNSGTAGLTTADLDKYTRIEVPEGVDPLQILLDMREDER